MESWEFGRMVRQWRDKVAPETIGVPQGRRRRATGLRREELAAAAGNFIGSGSRAVLTEQEHADLLAGMAADLRLTVSRYPADRSLAQLVDTLTADSPRFAELWRSADLQTRPDPARRKVIAHPAVGPITLDRDALVVAGDDLRIMVYTAEPGSEDADKLSLAIVLGTQSLIG